MRRCLVLANIFAVLPVRCGISTAVSVYFSCLNADAHIMNDTGSGAPYYDADGNGAGAAVQFAVLSVTTHPTLTVNDLLIVSGSPSCASRAATRKSVLLARTIHESRQRIGFALS